jgi:hypothetical protein
MNISYPLETAKSRKNNLPLVNEGDALFHIAGFERIELVESRLEELLV